MSEARQRKGKGAATKPSSAEDIPLAKPAKDKSSAKTIWEKADEQARELSKGQTKTSTAPKERQFVQPLVNPDGTFYAVKYQDASDEEMGELQESILYGVSLTMIFFTMQLMVYSQFAEKKNWHDILSKSFVALGIFLVLTCLMHPHTNKWWAQAMFLVGGTACGCHLVTVTSTQSSLALMASAPPLGTLWIWAVVEQRAEIALFGLAAVAGYYYFEGYSIFS